MEQCAEYSPVDKECRLFHRMINGEYLMTKIRDGRSCFYYGPLRDIKHLVESNTRVE